MASGLSEALSKLETALEQNKKEAESLTQLLEEKRRSLVDVQKQNSQLEEDIVLLSDQNEQIANSNLMLEDGLRIENETVLRLEDHLDTLKEKNRSLEELSRKELEQLDRDVREAEENLEKQAAAYHGYKRTRQLMEAQLERDHLKNLLKVITMREYNLNSPDILHPPDPMQGITSFKDVCVRVAEMRRERNDMERAVIDMEEEIKIRKAAAVNRRRTFSRRALPAYLSRFNRAPKVQTEKSNPAFESRPQASEKVQAMEVQHEQEPATEEVAEMSMDQEVVPVEVAEEIVEMAVENVPEFPAAPPVIPTEQIISDPVSDVLLPAPLSQAPSESPRTSRARQSPSLVDESHSQSSGSGVSSDFFGGIFGKTPARPTKPATGFGGFGIFNPPASPAPSESSDEGQQGFGSGGFFGFGGFGGPTPSAFGGPAASAAKAKGDGKKSKTQKPFSLF